MHGTSISHRAPDFRTHAGPGALDKLDYEMERTRNERSVLVCSHAMGQHQHELGRVEAAMGERLVARFTKVRAHSPLATVAQLADLLAREKADSVVVMGGGSAITTARAAVIVAAEQRPVETMATRWENGTLVSPKLTAAKITQWIVPSTPTTAYAKAGAAVHDAGWGRRLALYDPKARAAGVFFDPRISATAPDQLFLASSLNAFAMAVDGLQSCEANPLAQAPLLHGLRMLGSGLADRRQRKRENDVNMMLGALLVGQGSDHTGAGLSQVIAHVLGPLSTVGNGVIQAIMLPHVMKFNLGATDTSLLQIAQVVAPDVQEVDQAIAAVEGILVHTGIPLRLRDTGLERGTLNTVATRVLDDWMATTVPRTAGPKEIDALLSAAW